MQQPQLPWGDQAQQDYSSFTYCNISVSVGSTCILRVRSTCGFPSPRLIRVHSCVLAPHKLCRYVLLQKMCLFQVHVCCRWCLSGACRLVRHHITYIHIDFHLSHTHAHTHVDFHLVSWAGWVRQHTIRASSVLSAPLACVLPELNRTGLASARRHPYHTYETCLCGRYIKRMLEKAKLTGGPSCLVYKAAAHVYTFPPCA